MSPQLPPRFHPLAPLEVWAGRVSRRSIGSMVMVMVMGLALSLPDRVALAGDSEDEALIRQGIEKRRTNDDATALELFRKAYNLHHSPRAVGQMSLAEIALGRWVDAEAHLDEAVAAATDGWVVKNQATLRQSLERVQQHVGRLEVLGGVPGAEIVIEGEIVGTLPLPKPVRVRSGACRFVVRAPGYEPVPRDVEIAAGHLTRETVKLSKASLTPTVAGGSQKSEAQTGTPAGTEMRATPHAMSGANESQPADNVDLSRVDRGGNRLTTLGIVMGTVGIAAVATGVFFGVKARAAGEEASKRPMFDPSADSTGHRYQSLQYIGYGIGGALVAAGIVTFVVGRSRNSEERSTEVAIVLTPRDAFAGLLGHF